MTPTLGYAVMRRPTARRNAAFLAAASGSEDGECVESTWSEAPDDALILPSPSAAVMLACAVGAGRNIVIAAAIGKRKRMKKREIAKLAATYADDLAAACGDPDAAREAWIDVGSNNAGWKRRGAKGKSAKPKAKRAAR